MNTGCFALILACTHQFYAENPLRIYRRMLTIIRLGVLSLLRRDFRSTPANHLWEAFTPATSENRPTYLH